MSRKKMLVVAAIALSVCVSALSAGERGPSTSDERAKYAERVRALEASPLAEGAREARQSLFEWLVEVPDVEAKVCANLLGKSRDDKYSCPDEVTLHELLAAGRFAVEHPDKSRDDIAMYIAGVEGALRAYEAIIKLNTDSKCSPLDEMIALRDHGELAAYIGKVAKKKCK